MKSFVSKFQIGKNGPTEGVIESLNLALKNHKQVRVSVLKSCCRDRVELQKITQELQKGISFKCSFRAIGYTIIISKLHNKV
jgi:RNA-binding protein YhbY